MRHILRLIFVTYNFCDLLMCGFKKFVYHSIGYLLRVIPTGMPNLLYKFQSLLGCSFNGQAPRLWCGPLLHVCNFGSQFFFLSSKNLVSSGGLMWFLFVIKFQPGCYKKHFIFFPHGDVHFTATSRNWRCIQVEMIKKNHFNGEKRYFKSFFIFRLF